MIHSKSQHTDFPAGSHSALAHSHLLFHFFCSDVKKLYIDKVCFYFLLLSFCFFLVSLLIREPLNRWRLKGYPVEWHR